MKNLSLQSITLKSIFRGCLYLFCTLVFMFLTLPILAIIPLSVNSSSFLTYPMAGVSLRWYQEFLTSGEWLPAIWNSLLVATATTALATPLGVSAALGLARARSSSRPFILAALLSPMIVPVIITAIGVYFLYAPLGLTNNYWGLIISHTTLAVPFVVIVVHATLKGFNPTLLRAAANLGASPIVVFFRVELPLIFPGVVSGGLFAFIVSFDEIVVTLFVAGPGQKTLPLQMFNGVREQISPVITVAATFLFAVSGLLLVLIEITRRWSERTIGGGNAGQQMKKTLVER